MKYCVYDKIQLIELKTDSSWEQRFYCDNCETRFKLTLGDKMGGSLDTIEIFERKFNKEEKK